MANVLHGKIVSKNSSKIEIDCGDGVLCNVTFACDNVVRVLFTRDGALKQHRSWSILPRGENDVPWDGVDKMKVLDSFPPPTTETVTSASTVVLSTSALSLEVSLSPLRMVWKNSSGVQIASDRPSRPYFFSKCGNGIKHYMQRNVGDRFHGLGDKTGDLNLAGRRLRTAMLDALGYDPQAGDPLYKHWPFLIVRDSLSGEYYGILYDNLSQATFDLGCEHSNYFGKYRSYEAEDGDLDMYFISGPSLKKVVQTNAYLTGGMALGPRWSLGYHCTAMPLADSSKAQERISEFISLCKEHEIPCSAFHFGSGYTSIGSKRYVFHWNKEKFPDPQALIGEFLASGMQVVANLKPCLLTDHPSFAEVAKSGAFIRNSNSGEACISQFWDGEGAHLDFTNQAAIDFWQGGLNRSILDYGISSAWNDNNEYEIWDERASCHGFGQPMGIQLSGSLQSLLMTRASFEQQRAHNPLYRVYTVTRAGCFGIQRYAQTWTGDNTTSWQSLRYNLRTGLQMSLSGLFNIGHDVGGFAGESPGPELLVRWVQAGTLHPRFIMNSWKDDGQVTTPWLHPSVVPMTRSAIRLRYRLVPYLYSVYRQAVKDHVPILRPTFYEFPEDGDCLRESDDLVLGSNLLAAPVVTEGERVREVYFPKGPRGWYDFYSGEWYPSGTSSSVSAPLEKMPLFAKSGCLLPVTFESENFGRLHDEPSRLVRIFPFLSPFDSSGVAECSEAQPEFLLWEDDGISVDGGEETFRVLKLSFRENVEEIEVVVESLQGSFVLPYSKLFVSLPPNDKRKLQCSVIGLELEVVQESYRFHFY